MRRTLLPLVLLSVAALPPPAASQGIPVIDRAAIANLIQQITYWQQQLNAMTRQLDQLHQTHAALTGDRGMHTLLNTPIQQRNYLPPDHAELINTLNGRSVTYTGLATKIQQAMSANAVLSNTQLATLSPDMRKLIENGRKGAALVATLSQAAYQNTSQRFQALQHLIATIGTTGDLKAIQDLQGRITAEQAMLTNEQTKLQVLFQMAQGDRLVQEQRARERSAADVGSVNSLTSVAY
ncbi:Type IV secretion system protein virB5 [Burkholderiales bacterium]|nr:Type IV secretion system protein virB5 [Burkholderiales bacterium]